MNHFLTRIFALLGFALSLSAETTVTNLRCEGLSAPLGIDMPQPRLGWRIDSDQRGEAQTAYRVLVASTPELLAKDQGNVWDSGKVVSAQSAQIDYGGKPLAAATPYCWKVCVWGKQGGAGPWSSPASFATGLFGKADWQAAQWIAFRPEEEWRSQWAQSVAAETQGVKNSFPWLTGQGRTIWEHDEAARPAYDPSPLFRKEFTLERPVRKATLFICGLGYCEAFLNGQRVGDHVLDPAWTGYHKRAFYVAHDVTAQLKTGVNALGAMLGRGQFSPLCNDIWGLRRAEWIAQPRLIARLAVTFDDGSAQDIITDASWRTVGGPITYDDTRHGEIYDARREQPGWSSAGFDAGTWRTSAVINAQNPLQAQLIPPIREFPALAPVRRIERSKQELLYDIGLNLSGWARVTVQGPAGAKVLVDYAEVPFDPELRGNLPYGQPNRPLAHPEDTFRDLTAGVRQQNGYILKGGGPETFSCHFSYMGFQFIRVVADGGVDIGRVEAVPVHSDLATVGEFECSNPLLNQIQKAAQLTFLNNFHSIQTDCPHREKQGWTADLYLTAEAAMFNFDMANFYAKCVTDMADTQTSAGGLSTVAPSGPGGGDSTLWPAAMVYVPADLLTFYGDRRTVAQHFEAMKGFARSSLKRQVPGKPEIITDVLGDWASPLDRPAANGDTYVCAPPEGRTLYGTAAHYRVVDTLARLARQLGKAEEAREFDDWARRIATAFNQEFLDAGKNQYHGETPTGYRQAVNAVPLDYGLVPASARGAVLSQLVENVHDTRGDRLNTGFVGTPALLEVLAAERPEIAYALTTKTAYPGWGSMMQTGATTMYEQFGGDNSHNHPMYGCISSYFFKYLAGIKPDPAAPGFSHFAIKPSVVGDLTWVRAHFDSPYGRIASSWKRTGNKLALDVSVPANTTATVYVPALSGLPATGVEGVTERGNAIADSQGVNFLRMEAGAVVLAVESGSYQFVRQE
jgi:alpha-L-rhamnosidase